jgi:hypothetical protein
MAGMEKERGNSQRLQKQMRQERGQLSAATFEGIKDLYQWQMEVFDFSNTSDYYHYTSRTTPVAAPYFNMQIAEAFYAKSVPTLNSFYRSQELLENKEAELLNDTEISVPDLLRNGEDILDAGYELVRDFSKLNSAKASQHRNFSQFGGVQKFQLQKFYDEIGTQKPESFRDTMRRYIPRWMTTGISYPQEGSWDEHVPPEETILIHPDRLAEGEVPLHTVFQAAKSIENSGKKELGYLVRTSAIVSVLDMEAEKIREDAIETPFFHSSFARLMTGGMRTSRNAYFDFQQAVSETMKTTFSKFQKELAEGKPGLATNFLQDIAGHYPKKFPELLARSIVNHEADSDFNAVVLLRGLNEAKLPWIGNVHEHVSNLPERRVLGASEMEKLAPIDMGDERNAEITLEQFMADGELLAGSGDEYGFRVPLSKLDMEVSGLKSEIEINLDSMSESIDAVINCTDGKMSRSIPYSLSFSGEKESFRMETVDRVQVSDPSLEKYRTTVARAIKREADKIRAREQKKDHSKNGQIVVFDQTPDLLIPKLTREERMKLYESQKPDEAGEKGESGVKKNDVQNEHAVGKDVAEKEPEKKITGLDYDNVDSMLKDSKIEVVSADTVIKKLNHFTQMANVSGKPFGKPVSLSGIRNPDGIALRQINWVLDGGNTQIRIYLQHAGEKDYALEGIMNKKGSNHQQRYLEQLVKQIKKEN